jgi:DNA-binding NarL/FixJ family response regulator
VPDVAADAAGKPQFTPHQYEVLGLLSQGLTNKAIGRRLNLSENTIRGHVQAILLALDVDNRAEAAFAARRRGLVS